MIKNSIIIFSLIIVFFSCKKDTAIISPISNSPTSGVLAQDSMLPLAVGNYWIYQKSNDDTLGNLNLQNDFDSVYVEKDTFIVGEHYFKFRHTNMNFHSYYFFQYGVYPVFIKYSSSYLVTQHAGILLDKIHIRDTIRKDVFSIYEYACTVPDDFTQKQFIIGTYSGISMNTIFYRNHPLNTVVDTACVQMFVNKIGIIKSVYSFSSCLKHCRYSNNLIRYHLN